MKASRVGVVAAALLMVAPVTSGCFRLREQLGLPRIAPRVRDIVPRPRTVARAARAVTPRVHVRPTVVIAPAPIIVASAPAPVVAPPVYVQQAPVALPYDERDVAWQNFMANPPIQFDPGFLNSAFVVDQQSLAMMGVDAQTIAVGVQQLLANLILMDAASPVFNIVGWYFDPATNTYSVTINADTNQLIFQFVFDPNAGTTQAYVTVDGQTVVAWPIVISMGLHQ